MFANRTCVPKKRFHGRPSFATANKSRQFGNKKKAKQRKEFSAENAHFGTWTVQLGALDKAGAKDCDQTDEPLQEHQIA